jgi:hypothetical protein
MPTRKSPAWGVIEVAVGVVLMPMLLELVSIPAIPETSDTSMWPSAAPAREAVTVVAPDVPVDPKPTQTSAVPFDACWKPVTCCQVTPPPDTLLASKPAAVETDASVPIRATRASPAVTPFVRLTDQEDWAENVPWFSWTTAGAVVAGPAFRASMVTSYADDGDQLNEADGVEAVPTFQYV